MAGSTPDYDGAPLPRSSLGAWLLKQARDLRSVINELTSEAAADHREIEKLKGLVDDLLAEAGRSAKVQAAQGAELERVKRVAEETNRQLNGIRVSRGIYKAKAKKLLDDMQNQLN